MTQPISETGSDAIDPICAGEGVHIGSHNPARAAAHRDSIHPPKTDSSVVPEVAL